MFPGEYHGTTMHLVEEHKATTFVFVILLDLGSNFFVGMYIIMYYYASQYKCLGSSCYSGVLAT